MQDFLLVGFSTVLLAMFTALQTLYQRKAGASLRAGMAFNIGMGLFGAVLFWGMCGFRAQFTAYSAAIAMAQSLLVAGYTLIGFRVLQMGGMVLYTMFLMTGGMVVPFLWGILFLGEEFTLSRVVGLVMIVLSVVLFNSGSGRPSLKLVGMCVAVFFLNGFVSVLSKLHQIETVHPTVSTEGFVMLVNLCKTACCFVAWCILLRGHPTPADLPNRRLIVIMILCALLGAFSYQFQLIGAVRLPATVLYPLITGGSILGSAFLGLVCFHERPSVRGWAGIALCILGAICNAQ